MPIHWGLTNKPLRLKPEGCPNGLGEHSALLAQAGVFFLLHGKRRHPVGFSFRAEAGEAKVHQPPLVLIGDILSPGGSECLLRGLARNVLLVPSLPVFLVVSSRPGHREARGASRGNAHGHRKTRFPSACASGFAARGFPVGSREVPLPNRPLLWTCAVNERGGARALERAPEASEARRAKRSERAVNGGQGRPT